MNSISISTGSLPTLLGVAFVILKLTHVITWSWVWVLAPFWIPWALGLLIVGVFLVYIVVAALWK